MTKNQAAWLVRPQAKPLEVAEAPEWKPGPGEVLIKNAAVAINPVEWKIQDFEQRQLQYPTILGGDIAGVVEGVGEGVTRFQKGQRVMAYCTSVATGNPAHGGFQLYTIAPEILTSPIPDSFSYERAVVLPVALSTAAAGLYLDTTLSLPLPALQEQETTDGSSRSNGTILIWGAASSVGAAAVQLARASGLRVIATASERNFDLVRSLGASYLFDYRSSSIVDDVVAAIISADNFVGIYDAISSPDTFALIGSIVEKTGPAKVAVVTPPPQNRPANFHALMTLSFTLADTHYEKIGDCIWRKYIPEALKRGQLQAKPDAFVFGSGLNTIQAAIDRQKAGVSAQKIVVTYYT